MACTGQVARVLGLVCYCSSGSSDSSDSSAGGMSLANQASPRVSDECFGRENSSLSVIA